MNRLVHAQCGSHPHRTCVDAERAEPRLVTEALDRIGCLYEHEAYVRHRGLEAELRALVLTRGRLKGRPQLCA
ncbi:MAG TPA: hypothetical protein VGX03_11220, partial [Candidatus Binatia bacterium]|nr:hypothetical protein [Candidatus Binatia bacterium]